MWQYILEGFAEAAEAYKVANAQTGLGEALVGSVARNKNALGLAAAGAVGGHYGKQMLDDYKAGHRQRVSSQYAYGA